MLTQEHLKSILKYNKISGEFVWSSDLENGIKKGKTAGTTTAQGYRQIRIERRFYRAHRLAWLYEYGSFPLNQIDHIDGDRANNAIHNLRDVTSAVNHQNKRQARSDNKLGILGVSKKRNKFRAQIAIGGDVKQIGVYETPQLAKEAYIEEKRVLHAEGNTI